ncbi:hypothetical protein RvY_04108 [Ramazzottius varieornatus]|uniref:Uncharacterized protein n=1 Tax=Ramazzottius varieornatus TaxID=947166 RepID=A0A1D1UW43_RAMVA|nr:hypothetical protein RvY_04108 [Ramazzottius varieornatus]
MNAACGYHTFEQRTFAVTLWPVAAKVVPVNNIAVDWNGRTVVGEEDSDDGVEKLFVLQSLNDVSETFIHCLDKI